jgi:hypothetical protein
MPRFDRPYDASYEEIARDTDLAFGIFDKIEWLQFVGGEIFLHGDIARIFARCAKHVGKFDRLIAETNATLPVSDSQLAALELFVPDVEVMISDYGPLSRNLAGLAAGLEARNIPYRLKKYHGERDEQHFGGWLDNGGLRDYGETEAEVAEKAAKCAQVRLENMHVFRGKLHRCSNSLFMTELGILTPDEGDFVDLTDNALTRGQKRGIIADFYAYPRKSCRFCRWKNGDDKDTPRYPAAEQLPRKEKA